MNSAFVFICFVIVGIDLVYGGSKDGNATKATMSPKQLGTPPPPRKLGETCRENGVEHFCTGQGVEMMCPEKNDTCLCKLGYEPDGSSGSCKVKYRNLGETCREKGQTNFWYFCGGFGVEVVCPESNKCQCRPGYEPDGKTGGCKVSAPKTDCSADTDCTGSWTQCQKGKCTCLDGFQPTKGNAAICEPTGFNCPGGEKALTDPKTKSVQLCEVDISNDTCPIGAFCNYWTNTMTENHGFAGHCCPRVVKISAKTNTSNSTTVSAASLPSVCPVGVPHKTGYCPDLRKNATAAVNESNACPFGNEYGCTLDGACCPRPCRSSHSFFNYKGECFDRVMLDSPCKLSSQCVVNAECSGGTCKCKKGFQRNEALCSAPAK